MAHLLPLPLPTLSVSRINIRSERSTQRHPLPGGHTSGDACASLLGWWAMMARWGIALSLVLLVGCGSELGSEPRTVEAYCLEVAQLTCAHGASCGFVEPDACGVDSAWVDSQTIACCSALTQGEVGCNIATVPSENLPRCSSWVDELSCTQAEQDGYSASCYPG